MTENTTARHSTAQHGTTAKTKAAGASCMQAAEVQEVEEVGGDGGGALGRERGEEPGGQTPLFLWRQAQMRSHATLHAFMHTHTHARTQRKSKEGE